jgi:hypothetical protein
VPEKYHRLYQCAIEQALVDARFKPVLAAPYWKIARRYFCVSRHDAQLTSARDGGNRNESEVDDDGALLGINQRSTMPTERGDKKGLGVRKLVLRRSYPRWR